MLQGGLLCALPSQVAPRQAAKAGSEAANSAGLRAEVSSLSSDPQSGVNSLRLRHRRHERFTALRLFPLNSDHLVADGEDGGVNEGVTEPGAGERAAGVI